MIALAVVVGGVAVVLGIVGARATNGRPVWRAALVAVACVLAVPWALFMAYYAHLVDYVARSTDAHLSFRPARAFAVEVEGHRRERGYEARATVGGCRR